MEETILDPHSSIACKHANYARVEGMREHRYDLMEQVEEMLDSYLSLGEASTLKAPTLPTKPLDVTSHLNCRAYTAAGQAGRPCT